MSLLTLLKQPKPATAGYIDALVAEGGSGAHPHLRSGAVLTGLSAGLNFADAAHFLCVLHGRHPGVIENAARKAVDPTARRWMDQTADAFGRERAFLSQLSAAAGPAPSTPGHDRCEAAVAAQCKAVDMLAESERSGCAVGTAIALVLDWRAIRTLLDIGALRLGMLPPDSLLPDLAATAALTAQLADRPATERAMAFGAQQLIAQHSGLWDLLAARATSRARR